MMELVPGRGRLQDRLHQRLGVQPGGLGGARRQAADRRRSWAGARPAAADRMGRCLTKASPCWRAAAPVVARRPARGRRCRGRIRRADRAAPAAAAARSRPSRQPLSPAPTRAAPPAAVRDAVERPKSGIDRVARGGAASASRRSRKAEAARAARSREIRRRPGGDDWSIQLGAFSAERAAERAARNAAALGVTKGKPRRCWRPANATGRSCTARGCCTSRRKARRPPAPNCARRNLACSSRAPRWPQAGERLAGESALDYRGSSPADAGRDDHATHVRGNAPSRPRLRLAALASEGPGG